MTLIKSVASQLQTSDTALCITLSLFLGYPLAYIYRGYIQGKAANLQHAYFSFCGTWLLYFNFGIHCAHSFVNIIVAYVLCKFLCGTLLSVGLAFCFHMGYLLVGYALKSDDVDISWTLPQCVLTLRLIGLVFDCYDGHVADEAKLTEDQKQETALQKMPGFAEIAGYSLFPFSLLVGPQYPMRKYRAFIAGEFCDPKTGLSRDSLRASLLRTLPGCAYMAAHQVLNLWLPTAYFLTPEFEMNPLIKKIALSMLWWRIASFKYIAVWLIVEGVCIFSGIAFNGVDSSGKIRWDGLRNVRLTQLELGCSFQDVIDSYNVLTNQFVLRYVYKRLKFLNSKSASQLLSLLFLGLWHGFFSGYYMVFLVEYVCVLAERSVMDVVNRLPEAVTAKLKTPTVRPIVWVVCKCATLYGCAFGFLPFVLLRFEKWWQVHKALQFSGWWIFGLLIPAVCYLLRRALPKHRKSA